MILTFHVPFPLRGQGLCDIDSLQPRKIQKKKHEMSKSLNLSNSYYMNHIHDAIENKPKYVRGRFTCHHGIINCNGLTLN